ncbi:YoaK family protein [Streptomyces sp. NBC_00344]|uniref:YoaK family protein n=1 Tax=Streptomyces sp. NBC_00344 TaxID=2975720 RepID=UPI002E20CEEB
MPRNSSAGRSRDTALVLLTAASGSVDALAFIALGHVFAGVMTGNLVLLAIGLGSRSPGDAGFALVALAGFSVAVVVTGRVLRPVNHLGADGNRTGPGGSVGRGWWTGGVYACLAVETFVLAVLGVVWAVVGGRPDGAERGALIAVLAVAMGLQTGAMLAAGPGGAPTTYFTSTLSNLLISPAGGLVAAARVVALVVGAVGAAALHTWDPAWAALPPPLLTATALILAMSKGPRRRGT